jgi:hypothetical protein
VISDIITKEQGELIFAHYHNLKKYKLSRKIIWGLVYYEIYENSKNILLNQYIKYIINIENNLDVNFISPVYEYRKQSFLVFFIKNVKNVIRSLFIKRQYKLYKKMLSFQELYSTV